MNLDPGKIPFAAQIIETLERKVGMLKIGASILWKDNWN
jgi:hypothetical protein